MSTNIEMNASNKSIRVQIFPRKSDPNLSYMIVSDFDKNTNAFVITVLQHYQINDYEIETTQLELFAIYDISSMLEKNGKNHSTIFTNRWV